MTAARFDAAVAPPLVRIAASCRKAPFARLKNGHPVSLAAVCRHRRRTRPRDNPSLSRRHDCPRKLGCRTTRDRDRRRLRELTPVFATPRPVTILIRDVQPHEFPSVLHFPVDVERRSDNFPSQTVTSLFWSTAVGRAGLLESLLITRRAGLGRFMLRITLPPFGSQQSSSLAMASDLRQPSESSYSRAPGCWYRRNEHRPA